MKYYLKIFMLAAAVLAVPMVSVLSGEIRVISDSQDTRPAIWKNADGVSVLRAEEVARMDAWAKLAEFIGGMEVKGVTSVKDMVSVDQGIHGFLRARISNMSTEDIVYYENGLVQCKISARLSDIVETVSSYMQEEKVNDSVTESEKFRGYNMEPSDRTVTIWGNGGLDGTEAIEIIQAIRAAELAATEQMVAMLEGVQIGRETKVKDFVLASDRIKACIDDFSKGVQYIDYAVRPNVVEVTAHVRFVTIIERLERVYEEVNSTDLCTGCPVVTIKEFEETVQHEETMTHETIGKAAREKGGVQIRPANAERAMNEARAVRKSEKSFEKSSDSSPIGDPERVVKKEIIEEKVVKKTFGVD